MQEREAMLAQRIDCNPNQFYLSSSGHQSNWVQQLLAKSLVSLTQSVASIDNSIVPVLTTISDHSKLNLKILDTNKLVQKVIWNI